MKSIDYSWCAIDIGFDLRIQGIKIEIPVDCRTAAYDGADGKRYELTGNKTEIRDALISAGYEVYE